MNETEIIKTLNDYIKSPYKCDTCRYCSGQINTQKAIEGILDLYQKEKEKNKELERKWEEEKYLIKLAENELLGYSQGYEDGLNHNSTATQQIIKNREYQITQQHIEKLNNWISGLKEELEKEKEKNKELTDEYMIQKHLINPDFLKDYTSKDKIREKIEEIKNYTFMSNEEMKQQDYAIIKLKELLEENNGTND